jgi:GntR family transcriptional repressor for pyruvate dehydrogenase complex
MESAEVPQAMRFDRSPRLSNQVLDVLLYEVVQEAVPGSLLPRESDLAERFGISRGVTREVLRGLEERGVVTVRHGHGAIVNDPDEWDILDGDVLNALLHGRGQITGLREVLECRQIIEVQVAALAAERAGADELAGIEKALDAMRAAASRDDDSDSYTEADLAFHEALARATGNRALYRVAEPLSRAFVVAHRPLARVEVRQNRSVPEHARVFEAVKARDSEAAASAMKELLSTVEGFLLSRQADDRPAAPAAAQA